MEKPGKTETDADARRIGLRRHVIKSDGDLRGQDLTGADMSGLDLTGHDFTGCRMPGCVLRNCAFIGDGP